MSLNELSLNSAGNIGVIVLAAGASGRLGQPKQLVNFRGKPLLQQILDCSIGIRFQSNVLVLGANHEMISETVEHAYFSIAINDKWEEGMSGSLRIGVQKSLESTPDLEALLILVSDQPFVDEELFKKMLESFRSSQDIVACEYGGNLGVPVLFGKAYFDELMNQSGDRGAKQVLKDHIDLVRVVPFAQGIFDIDTQEDLKRLSEI